MILFTAAVLFLLGPSVLAHQDLNIIDFEAKGLTTLLERMDRMEKLLEAQRQVDISVPCQTNEDVGRLYETVGELKSLLQAQSRKFSSLEKQLRVQAVKLLWQGDAVQQLSAAASVRHQKAGKEGGVRGGDVALSQGEGRQDNYMVGKEDIGNGRLRHFPPDRYTTASSLAPLGNMTSSALNSSMASSKRHVMARSDDAGPLQATVNQMSQRMTEMSADLQAFKTQTTAEVETLRSQTSTDLNNLRSQTTSDLQTLRDTNSQQDQQIQDSRTSTFVRWGNSQCSNSSQLVYSGVVGGGPYDQPGTATNYLCLTMSPVLLDHDSSNAKSFLHGTEFWTLDSHQNDDPMCAVCRSSLPTTIMIPGTNVCTQGWQKQYSGYLMAGHMEDTAGSQFICVDSALEGRPGSNADMAAREMTYTFAACGSTLPCGPYVNNKMVTCVVCSR